MTQNLINYSEVKLQDNAKVVQTLDKITDRSPLTEWLSKFGSSGFSRRWLLITSYEQKTCSSQGEF